MITKFVYKIRRWFQELGQVYTLSDWLREYREVERQMRKETAERNQVFLQLIKKEKEK